MKRESILAHRGLFLCESEKNSSVALARALREGFGIETDLRDLDGMVVISHDPPTSSSFLPSFEWLLEQIRSSPYDSRIGLNIKSDGLSTFIQSAIQKQDLDTKRFFAFDMSIPDSFAYLKGSVPTYSRLSEYEPWPAFLKKVNGVWIDNFYGSFPQVKYAAKLLEQGFRVTIVSAELHGRDHTLLWDDIVETGLYLSPLFEICTDFPVEAANRFCND